MQHPEVGKAWFHLGPSTKEFERCRCGGVTASILAKYENLDADAAIDKVLDDAVMMRKGVAETVRLVRQLDASEKKTNKRIERELSMELAKYSEQNA